MLSSPRYAYSNSKFGEQNVAFQQDFAERLGMMQWVQECRSATPIESIILSENFSWKTNGTELLLISAPPATRSIIKKAAAAATTTTNQPSELLVWEEHAFDYWRYFAYRYAYYDKWLMFLRVHHDCIKCVAFLNSTWSTGNLDWWLPINYYQYDKLILFIQIPTLTELLDASQDGLAEVLGDVSGTTLLVQLLGYVFVFVLSGASFLSHLLAYYVSGTTLLVQVLGYVFVFVFVLLGVSFSSQLLIYMLGNTLLVQVLGYAFVFVFVLSGASFLSYLLAYYVSGTTLLVQLLGYVFVFVLSGASFLSYLLAYYVSGTTLLVQLLGYGFVFVLSGASFLSQFLAYGSILGLDLAEVLSFVSGAVLGEVFGELDGNIEKWIFVLAFFVLVLKKRYCVKALVVFAFKFYCNGRESRKTKVKVSGMRDGVVTTKVAEYISDNEGKTQVCMKDASVTAIVNAMPEFVLKSTKSSICPYPWSQHRRQAQNPGTYYYPGRSFSLRVGGMGLLC